MKILIAGASGLIGTKLSELFRQKNHEVYSLVRTTSSRSPNEILWQPDRNQLEIEKLSGFDAIINLSGESIAKGRWNNKRKKSLLDSRINTTNLLVEAINRLENKPKVFVCASAIGYYADRGSEELSENDLAGDSFLSEICIAWEKAASKASVSTRVVNLRFGVVLSSQGGALSKMLPIFKLGLGGRLGSGKQYISWVHIDDAVKAIFFCTTMSTISGPVNIVSPEPVTNTEFTKTLAQTLNRPAIFPAPAFVLTLALGQMAKELLLSSQKVIPGKLSQANFTFQYSSLRPALKNLLGCERNECTRSHN